MQPHPPQLPTQDPRSPAPKNLKRGALFLLAAIVVVAALIAFLVPKKHVEPGSTEHRTSAESPAYAAPTAK